MIWSEAAWILFLLTVVTLFPSLIVVRMIAASSFIVSKRRESAVSWGHVGESIGSSSVGGAEFFFLSLPRTGVLEINSETAQGRGGESSGGGEPLLFYGDARWLLG